MMLLSPVKLVAFGTSNKTKRHIHQERVVAIASSAPASKISLKSSMKLRSSPDPQNPKELLF
jgi:hypothetical protein